jgi:hypothetical protein
VDDVIIVAIRLEARSDDCLSWRQRRLPSDVKPLTEREGAKLRAQKRRECQRWTWLWLHQTSRRLGRNGDKKSRCSGNDVKACDGQEGHDDLRVCSLCQLLMLRTA